jgi:hypothetical protein
MDLSRILGIAIVMIIPTFVFCGLVYSWFHSYIVVFAVMILMAVLYGHVISGRFSAGRKQGINP